jgi:large subunit ribosomal protein L29
MTDEELKQRLVDRAEALRNFHFQMATGAVDNVRGARNARRDIARIQTIMRQRQPAAPKQSEVR